MNAHYIGPLRSMWESKETFISWSGAGFLVHYSSKALLRAQTSDRKGRLSKPITMPLLLSYDYTDMACRDEKKKIHFLAKTKAPLTSLSPIYYIPWLF